MIALVSEQPMPTLLAAFNARLVPDRLVLLCTAAVRRQARRVAEVASRRGVACDILDVTDPFDDRESRGLVQRTAALAISEGAEVVVNLTGGTKPMSLGAYQGAVSAGVQACCYVEHEGFGLRWIGSDRPPAALDTILSLEEVLQAHGFIIKGEGRAQSQQLTDLARSMLSDMPFEAVSLLNQLAQKVQDGDRNRRKLPPVGLDQLGGPAASADSAMEELMRWLDRAAALGLVEIEAGAVRFRGRDEHDFLRGGWLEVATEACLQRLGPRLGASDIRRSLDLQTEDGLPNELDVAFLWRRRLCVIECKTARLGGRGNLVKPADIAYKLAAADYGGRETRRALVSLDDVQPAHRRRFDAKDIHVIDGAAARRLDDAFAAWLEG